MGVYERWDIQWMCVSYFDNNIFFLVESKLDIPGNPFLAMFAELGTFNPYLP